MTNRSPRGWNVHRRRVFVPNAPSSVSYPVTPPPIRARLDLDPVRDLEGLHETLARRLHLDLDALAALELPMNGRQHDLVALPPPVQVRLAAGHEADPIG